MTAIVSLVRQIRRWRPRRAAGLPPGQRQLDHFPRFSYKPLRPPPTTSASVLRLSSANLGEILIPLDELRSSDLSESRRSDFHCVTTWTAPGQTWTGVPIAAWWTARIGPLPREPFAIVRAADGYRAVLLTEDLFADQVMLAWALNDGGLDQQPGAPLRLVSPAQYGYKNVKHVESIELHDERPASLLGPKEHLRARVALEERHSRIPGRIVRWPYRFLAPITAIVSERTLRSSRRAP